MAPKSSRGNEAFEKRVDFLDFLEIFRRTIFLCQIFSVRKLYFFGKSVYDIRMDYDSDGKQTNEVRR